MTDIRPAPTGAQPRRRSWATLWYYLVVVASVGLLTAIPFAHAARQLRGHRSRRCIAFAVLYTVAEITAIAVAMTLGRTTVLLNLVVYVPPIVAIVHLTFVRAQIARSVVDPESDRVVRAAL